MHKYIIGIDTGGTYTDAVLLDKETGKVLAKAKKPTTHYALARGTGEALAELLRISGANPAEIHSVCISSTLATNSVVENKGARVAVIVIGYVKHFKLPVTAVVFVKGGHNIHGEEEEPLDIEYLVSLVEGLKNEVDAYGVCSAMSMHNPAHELVTEKAIAMLDPKPVFSSHRISRLTGMQQRAATAGLHAKLMPVMDSFVRGVHEAMTGQHLTCPMVVIGGNGKPIAADRAIAEAALTVASGPACTAHFGAAQGVSECLVIDVGGTTTDIAMIANGRPLLAADGCQIGQWKTHIEAIDMHTAGIGGDSHVHIDEYSQLTIGPSRVTPLAMVGAEIPPPGSWLGAANRSRLIVLRPEAADGLAEGELTGLLREVGRLTPATIRERTGLGGIPLDVQLEQLTRRQQIFECGFTPTDALHVLGEIDLGDREAAMEGAEILGRTMHLSGREFAELVVSSTCELIENMIIDYVIQHYWQNSLAGFIATRKNHAVLGVDFSLKIPLVGIGAAARYFLPAVAERLKTTVAFPVDCEVGNAVGAAMIGLSGER
ncbi:MAG: hydantoinase/oxoprolinase [Desulfobacterales bacterium GWB2_56_26]|nr:MAG: hydantoinase/oxoprolinase [Desulfobacterales bacterium GWB2_56_26]